ncbi:MAG: hypothetical protein KBG70_13720, partial [Chitinophagales bacterium]|nr:hypothetical protein [Chitinophagales bacterium]
ILHGFYDFFLFQNLTVGLYIGAVVSLIIGLRFTIRAMKLHKQNPNSFKQTTNTLDSVLMEEDRGFDSPTRPK